MSQQSILSNTARRAGVIVGALSVLWLGRIMLGDPISISVLVFMFLLLLNTFFSIKCFSIVHPAITIQQKIIDVMLMILYGGLILVESNTLLFLFTVVLLFIVATMKYALGMSTSTYRPLLERKIIINLLGSVAVVITILASMRVGADVSMNAWTIVYTIVNIDLLWYRPLYQIPR